MKKNLHLGQYCLLLAFLLFSIVGFSQQNTVDISFSKLSEQLKDAPLENLSGKNIQGTSIDIDVNERNYQLEVWDTPLMSPDFRAKFPEIRTFRFVESNDKSITGRITMNDKYLNIYLISPEGNFNIGPADISNPSTYVIIEDEPTLTVINNHEKCGFESEKTKADIEREVEAQNEMQQSAQKLGGFSNGATLRTYNFALVCTGEFHDGNGGTVASATMVATTTMNIVQAIYDCDMAIRFNLLTPLVYTNPATDPFVPDQTGGCSRTVQAANEVENIFSGMYDIGHVFHTSGITTGWSGGGVAGLGVVCRNNVNGGNCTQAGGSSYTPNIGLFKGRGWSGSFNNTTNGWYGLVAHEIGHMFDAPHTFNGIGGSCTGNISNSTSYEIGSGRTIMSYRGICQTNNNDPSPLPANNYFHTHSLERMTNYTMGLGNCQSAPSGNTPPTADANPCSGSYTIPPSTPFYLTGSGSDADGDALLYNWEQYDEDGAGATPTQGFIGATAGASPIAPLFRNYPPTSSPTRCIPPLADVVAGNMNDFEVLPTVSRIINFRLTVRDKNSSGGGIACDDLAITVDASLGAFAVTVPNGGECLNAGVASTITWTNNTSTICSNVDVQLSTDGGLTFTTIAAGVTNNGSASVTIPSGVTNTSTARIRVICADNTCVQFYDVSDADFQIKSSCMAPATEVSPTTSMTLPEGDPMLSNLGMMNNIGSPVTSFSGTLTTSDPVGADIVFLDGTPAMCNTTNNSFFDTYLFSPDVTGSYTFSHGGPFGTVLNIHTAPYLGPVCSNHVTSSATRPSGTGSISLSSSATVSLTAGQLYVLVISTFNTAPFPALPAAYNVTFSGPAGASVYNGVILPANYSYTYFAVNTTTGIVAAVSATSNFGALTAGNYKIYGASYYSGTTTPPTAPTPSTWVGSSLTSLQISTTCQSISTTCKTLEITPSLNCPTAVMVADDTGAVCDGGGTDDLITWQANVVAANPSTGIGSVVYSSVTPVVPTTPHNNTLPTGNHSGANNCMSEAQVVMAYIYCDNDNDGTVNTGDTYNLISTYTLTVYPEEQMPAQMVSGCTNTVTVACMGDVLGPAMSPTGGAAIANWNLATGVYTAQPGDAAGTIMIFISSGIIGSPCSGKNFIINTPACPFMCPGATTVADDNGAVCTGGGTDDLATWQAAVVAANPSIGAGSVVYSSVTPVVPGTAPNGTLPTGNHSALPSCSSETQTVMAYYWCDFDNNGAISTGDTYSLISTYTLMVYPEVQMPTEMVSGCTNTLTVACSGDGFGAASTPTGGASITNWNSATGIYTASAGDAAGTIMISISPGLVLSPCPTKNFVIQTPACPAVPTCNITVAPTDVLCNDSGTPTNTADDFITFTLNPSGTGIGTNYTVSASSGTVTPNIGAYGMPTSFQTQPGSAGGGNMTLTITDNTTAGCMTTVTLNDPGACSGNLPNCDCTNPQNMIVGGVLYVHDFVTITSGPGETWLISNILFGQMFMSPGGTQFIVGNILPEVAPGVYSIDLWYPCGTAWSAEFNRTMFPLAVPLATGESCDDNTAPTANCQNVTVSLDATGNGSTTAMAVNNSSTDDCSPSDLSLSLSQTAFTCADLGVNNVTLTVADAKGNESTCMAMVTVGSGFAVTCPTSTDLGSFNCTNLSTIPAMPTTMAAAMAAPYNISITPGNCGTIVVLGMDSATPNGCTTINQTITRTITIFADANSNGIQDIGEESQTCSFTYTVASTTALSVSCSTDPMLSACTSSAAITAAYNTWAGGFAVNDGCNSSSNISMIPALPAYVCGAGVSLSFTLSATDDCNTTPVTCMSTFTVAAATPLTVSCPTDPNLSACSSSAAITAAYNTWAGGFAVNDGCNASSNISMVPALPAYVCGQAVNLSFTLSATDDCNTTPVTCMSTFTVAASTPLTVSCPMPVNLIACSSETDISDAYNAWLSGFSNSDGCNVSVTSTPPALPAYVCGAAVSLSYTYTVMDDCGTQMCTSTFNVAASTPPVAMCNDITITIDGTGNYTLTPADISAMGAGSTSPCNLNMMVSPNMFTCSDVGPVPATLTVTDDCGATDMCQATINIIASQFCIENSPPSYNNSGGPMIADPCTCRGNGEFDEEVFVQSTSTGQMWTITSVSGLDPWNVGDVITDNNDNTYSAVGVHLDGVGFNIEVQSVFWPGLTLGISNICHYPDPVIENDLMTLCLNTPVMTLSGNAGLQSDGVTPIDGAGEFKINNIVATELDPLDLGVGTHTVEYCFDAGTPLGFTQLKNPAGGPPIIPGPPVGANSLQESQDDPGCERCILMNFEIQVTSSAVACNDDIQISLDSNCEGLVTADMILEGSYGCFDDYSVSLTADGATVANPLTGAQIGQTIIAKVTHLPSGNACWGSIILEDKSGPTITCPDPIFIDCSDDLNDIPAPTAVDNCGSASVFVVNEIQSGGDCTPLVITRTYGATDDQGNSGSTCSVTINVSPVSNVIFPDDITWDCNQYADFTNITDATAVNSLINIANACEETNRNNRLRFTGSGIPNVSNVNNSVCKFSVTHSDQLLEACQGAGTDVTFKILRTWSVLNHCDGSILTHIQVVKVADKTEPVFDLSDYETDYFINTTDGTEPHQTCGFNGTVEVPTISDDCSVVNAVSLEITNNGISISTGTPILDANGEVTGFKIETDLPEGGTYFFNFKATDACGNIGEATLPVRIIDNTPPVPICRELTQISLNSNDEGISEILANHFDEVSYDNCGKVFFKVRKMELGTCDDANIDKPEEVNYERGVFCNISDPQEWFDDDVKFCCEEVGTTVNVILRVYDINPVCNDWSSVPTLDDAAGTHFDPPCYNTCDLGGVTTEGLSLDNRYYNDCMIEVVVEDKNRPSCIPPADLWLTCVDIPENIDWDDSDFVDDLYGAPTVSDNCGSTVETISVSVNLDNCGVGTIRRNFRATDDSGNTSINACRQTIMVQEINNYCFTLPADFEGECNNVNNPDELTYVENGCDLIAITKELEELFAGGPSGECKKEIYTWHVINWCEYDGVSAPTEMPRADFSAFWRGQDREFCSDGTTLEATDPRLALTYPSTGYYTYKQHVKIFDNTAPVVSYDGDLDFCGGNIDEDPCRGDVNISIDIDEACTNALSSSWIIIQSTDPSAVMTNPVGGSSINQRLPLGTHTVRFAVADDCGNVSFYEVTFNVIDCKAPTPVCFNGLSVELMPTGMVGVWASDFDASSFDYCHDFEVTANVVTDRIRDGIINSADYVTTRPTTTEVIFDCNNVGTTTFVQLWVHELSGDGVNDDDYCIATIDVQDNMNACAASRVRIAGVVEDEKGENVQDVEVAINGTMNTNMMTSVDGQYSFDVVEGEDYTITPMKNDDIRNGVSTFDLALISKHVLNVQTLDSPYKMIAADANRSGSITTLDLVAIRKVILFVTSEFPNNTSWRFVEKDHVFSNSKNPFADVIPEVTSFNNAVGNNRADFIGVKIGDVNGDALPNGLGFIEERIFNEKFELNIKDQSFKEGEKVEVLVNSDFNSIDGFQTTLKFNTEKLRLTDIKSATLIDENFGTSMVDEGFITLSWNGVAEKKEAFVIQFTAISNGKLSQALSLIDKFTPSEAFKNNELKDVELNFGTSVEKSKFALFQNQPNPFNSETVIGFEIPRADEATLTIRDLSGKVLRFIKGEYGAGYNTVKVEMTNSLPNSVLIYELKTSTNKATKKMTIIK